MVIISSLIIGAAIGADSGIVIYLLGEVLGFLNGLCQIVTFSCDGTNGAIWGEGAFGKLMLICTIGGAVIGLIYGIVKAVEEAKENTAYKKAALSDADRAENANRAIEIQKSAKSVMNQCSENSMRTDLIQRVSYKATQIMSDIIKASSDPVMNHGEFKKVIKEELDIRNQTS